VVFMGERVYDIELECGCMLSLDKGGGLMPCHYGYGCGKPDCDEYNQCEDCLAQEKKCLDAWKELAEERIATQKKLGGN